MATATGKGGLRPMSVAALRRLMARPAVKHFHGERARVKIAYWAKEIEDEARARQDDWSDPAYGANGATS